MVSFRIWDHLSAESGGALVFFSTPWINSIIITVWLHLKVKNSPNSTPEGLPWLFQVSALAGPAHGRIRLWSWLLSVYVVMSALSHFLASLIQVQKKSKMRSWSIKPFWPVAVLPRYKYLLYILYDFQLQFWLCNCRPLPCHEKHTISNQHSFDCCHNQIRSKL